jgi:4-hydroxy-tetrahydrodipicolinate synthase
MKDGIKGIITALVTPFGPDYSIDEKGLRVLLKRQIENGVHGIAVVAGSGEYVNLSDTERSRVVEISVKEVNGRIPVIAGVFSPNTRDAVDWAKKAAGLGANALLVLTPMYNKPSMDGLIAHFRTIAEATNLPILIYNNPGRTGINLTPEDYLKLAEIPTICGIKECNRDLGTLSQTLSTLSSKWNSILFGDDDILYLALELGVRGGVITSSNVLPSRWVAMYNAIVKGDHETAKAIHYEVLPFFQAIYTYNHPALIKKTLTLLGLPAGRTRPPLADPTKEQEERLKKLIAAMKLTK